MGASHQQSSRQLQERLTAMPVAEVLASAVRFFGRRGGVYSAFLEKQGPGHVVLRGQGGEEIALAARDTVNGVAVTGSSYLFDAQVARFLDSLPPAPPMPPATPPVDDAVSAAELPGAITAGGSV